MRSNAESVGEIARLANAFSVDRFFVCCEPGLKQRKSFLNPTSAAAQVNVSYSGSSEFKPIEGASLSYATNTADKVQSRRHR